jgi:hypothetical protein
MNANDDVFHRPKYAQDMAQQLLHPTAFQLNVRSGVFLSGIRRIGKTTFLRQDLIPALEAEGALVIYVDLWADRSLTPSALVNAAVQKNLQQFKTPGSTVLERVKGMNVGALGITFGFQLDSIGVPGGVSIAQAITELIDKTGISVVLIVDEIQQALVSEDGYNLMHALKAARDAVNSRPGTQGYFLFLGTGSHKSLVTDMATRRSQPFMGAMTTTYQPLAEDFVAWKLKQLEASPRLVLPSTEVALKGFQTMGSRPEELLKALVQLQSTNVEADQAFPIICATLASAAADAELHALEQFGPLGEALFSRIASGARDGVSGLYSADSLEFYSKAIDAPIESPQVQNLVEKMIAANLITRSGHGLYVVADPFVREVWLSRKSLGSTLAEH